MLIKDMRANKAILAWTIRQHSHVAITRIKGFTRFFQVGDARSQSHSGITLRYTRSKQPKRRRGARNQIDGSKIAVVRANLSDRSIYLAQNAPGASNGKPTRIIDNIDIFDFELSDDDMAAIATLDQGSPIYVRTPEKMELYATWRPDVEGQK